jgi:death-on-curing protein
VSFDDREDEPRWLTESVLLAIHSQQIERYGGTHGVLDENVVRSSLARAINRWAYDDGADIADLAAAYLVGFARAQGLRDGNKRTALATALVFLSLNGYELHVPPAELYALMMRAATNTADEDLGAAYLRERIVTHG